MKKSLQELNVIDNFLFNELMMQEDKEKSKEFCRSILEPIIEMKINKIQIEGQRIMQGVDLEARGIQMDAYVKVYQDEKGEAVADVEIKEKLTIYDLEPNKIITASDEKRARLYHSLIDGHVFEAGTTYDKLPEVFVIMILPYDPFGMGRMVYTVKRRCIEEPDMAYEDGDTTLYLYAYGKKDIPSQRLADMLKFMVESTEENAEKAGLMNVNRMVQSIKRNRQLGVKYMQSWEEKMYYEEKGRKEGHASGLKEGLATGKAASVLELLEEIGTVPEELHIRIMEQKDDAVISKWLRLAAKCKSIEAFIEGL